MICKGCDAEVNRGPQAIFCSKECKDRFYNRINSAKRAEERKLNPKPAGRPKTVPTAPERRKITTNGQPLLDKFLQGKWGELQ